MTILSPGLLYSAQKLIETVSANPMNRDQYLWSFRTVLVSPADGVLELSTRCGWIGINEQLGLDVTEMGKKVQSLGSPEQKMRQQIRDFIQTIQPVWARLLPAGRSEALPFMPASAHQCFLEAELCKVPPTDEIIAWWDDIAAAARGRAADFLAQIGRDGERCSIEFEEQRVGRRPSWQSIESNKSGFELLSTVEQEVLAELQIEVKASVQSIRAAAFHLTRNEWSVAQTANRYVLHVWSMTESGKRIAVLTPQQIAAHVPINCGDGEWESVEIPFRAFQGSFAAGMLRACLGGELA